MELNGNNWYDNYKVTEAGIINKKMIIPLFLLMYGGFMAHHLSNLYKIDEQELVELAEKPEAKQYISTVVDSGILPKEILEKANIQEVKKEELKTPEKVKSKAEAEKEAKIKAQKEFDENIVAQTIYREARGEGEAGMRAVASAIFNRANQNKNHFRAVCVKNRQFCVWTGVEVKKRTYKDNTWEIAKKIAKEMFDGTFTSTVGKSTHFYNPDTVRETPSWAYEDKAKTKKRPSEKIGRHEFVKSPGTFR
jgi:spore germination cell wall hydrolase CwlJ-like protein